MLHKIKFQNNVTMCHYNRDQKKKKKKWTEWAVDSCSGRSS